jgi:U-box domain
MADAIASLSPSAPPPVPQADVPPEQPSVSNTAHVAPAVVAEPPTTSRTFAAAVPPLPPGPAGWSLQATSGTRQLVVPPVADLDLEEYRVEEEDQEAAEPPSAAAAVPPPGVQEFSFNAGVPPHRPRQQPLISATFRRTSKVLFGPASKEPPSAALLPPTGAAITQFPHNSISCTISEMTVSASTLLRGVSHISVILEGAMAGRSAAETQLAAVKEELLAAELLLASVETQLRAAKTVEAAHRLLLDAAAEQKAALMAALRKSERTVLDLSGHVSPGSSEEEMIALEMRLRESLARLRLAMLRERWTRLLRESVHTEFICPITMMLMIDPVICSDGFSYERAAIEHWLSTKNSSPMTNLPLANKVLIPNRAMKSAIDKLLTEAGSGAQAQETSQACTDGAPVVTTLSHDPSQAPPPGLPPAQQ